MHANVNGAKLSFDIEGDGQLVPDGSAMVERPVLFLLHGGPGHDHSYFKPWLSPLARRFQLVYLDHRGNGRSERTGTHTYNYEQMAADIDGLRTYLGLDRINLLGHSFGGMLALTYAVKYQHNLEKLVIASSTASRNESLVEARQNAAARATPEQKAIVNKLYDAQITTQEEFVEWWRVCLPMFYRNPDPGQIAAELDRTVFAFEVSQYMGRHETPSYDMRSRLAEITVPTLVIGGRHDWVTPPSQSIVIAEGIPDARLFIQENSGHFGFAEDQDEYLQTLTKFLHG